MKNLRPLLLALASASLIALELVWTRIFAAEFWYTFAFLVLSLAVMGLGLGGLALRLIPGLNRPQRLGPALLATAALAMVGPPVALHAGLDPAAVFAGWAAAGKFMLVASLLGSAFFAGGVAVALLFRMGNQDMPRLYMADLAGAGAGVVLAVVLMNLAGTPRTTFLVAVPLVLASLLAGGRWTRACSALLAAALVALTAVAPRLVARPRQERFPLLWRHWDALALVKVFRIQDADGEYRQMNIDNAAHTGTAAFDGRWQVPGREPFPFYLDPKPLLDRMEGTRTFMSLGAGGGRDVFMALQDGASEIHAVEVNPYLNRLLTRGELRDFSGRIYLDPRVKVVTEDARAYVRRFDGHFDVIYSLSSNSFAALASGAFAMAENYLFTEEAFRDYWRALTPRGYLVMDHQRYVPRLAAEALEALRRMGVAHPERHLAVYGRKVDPRQVLLLSRRELDPDTVAHAFLDLEQHDFKVMHRVYPDPEPGADPLVKAVVEEGWRQASARTPIDLSPCTDDRPFTAQLGRWQAFRFKGLADKKALDFNGFPASKAIVAGILLVTLLLVVPLNLLPFLRRGPRLSGAAWGYFFAIGAGFMIVEVVLIQRYTLFIGPSSYSVAAILLTLLLACAAGSRMAPRFADRVPFLGILACLVLEVLALRPLTTALAGLPMAGRVLVTGLCVAPLGFFMGMPFPKGARRAGELIDWGFAVNGAASVLGSAGIMLVSFQWGFSAALAVGGACYALALLLMRGDRAWAR